MLHRVKRPNDIHQGKWNGLGGKMMPGETPEECVIREVREESGLEIRAPKLCGILTFPNFDGRHDWYGFVYTTSDFEGELMSDPPEGDLAWIEDSRLLELPMWEGDRIFIGWIHEGRFFSAKFCYENGIFKGHEVAFHDTPRVWK